MQLDRQKVVYPWGPFKTELHLGSIEFLKEHMLHNVHEVAHEDHSFHFPFPPTLRIFPIKPGKRMGNMQRRVRWLAAGQRELRANQPRP